MCAYVCVDCMYEYVYVCECVCCAVWHYFWGDMKKCPLTPDRKTTTDQSEDTTNDHLVEPMKFTEITWNMEEGLFKYGGEVI